MAISKTAKVETEIEKVKGKISEFQARLRELEQKKTEIENTEIVGIVRGLDVDLTDLAAFLQAYRAQNKDAPEDEAAAPESDQPDESAQPEAAAPVSPGSTVRYNGDSYGQEEKKPGGGLWR